MECDYQGCATNSGLHQLLQLLCQFFQSNFQHFHFFFIASTSAVERSQNLVGGTFDGVVFLLESLHIVSEQSQNTVLLASTQAVYSSGTVNSNTVNSKFHLIRSYCEIFVYNCPNISCFKYTVNSNFHLIRSKTLPTNDFELTVPDLYKALHSTVRRSLAHSRTHPLAL